MSNISYQRRLEEIRAEAAQKERDLRGERHFTIDDIEALENRIERLKNDVFYWVFLGAGLACIAFGTIYFLLHVGHSS